MQVIFRVEGSAAIGMGHVSRCLALAGTLQKRGAEIAFLCTPRTWEYASRRMASAARPLLLPDNLSRDAQHCARMLEGTRPDWLVVDHYGLGDAWEHAMRVHAQHIMAIDDLGRSHDCDLLLDQNYRDKPEQRYAGKLPKGCRTLLGPAYALLRPGIAAARASREQDNQVPSKIFICFGGADPENMTLQAIDAVAALEKDLRMDVVAGAAHTQVAALKERCKQLPRSRFFVDHPAPEQLMAEADMAIGAGGTMTWERCALRLPAIVVSIAENQREVSEFMDARGVIRYLGPADQTPAEAIGNALTTLLADPEAMRRMAERAGVLVDGMGAERVAEALYND